MSDRNLRVRPRLSRARAGGNLPGFPPTSKDRDMFDKAMTKIAYTVGAHETPGDVYVANIDGTGHGTGFAR